MESSTVLAFRIFVMLSCLIIVPMAAIFGSAFPDVVKTVLVDRLVALASGKTEGGAANAQNNSGNAQPVPEAPRWGASQGEAPAWQGPGSAVEPAVSTAPSAFAPAHQSASFSEAAPPANPFATAQALPPGQPAAARSGEAAPGTVIQAGGAAWQASSDFTAMERKLREHGAVYYLLETWGNEGELYRFHCRMAIANNPNYTRHFEATDHDALKAMSQVLSRVEAWRAGRLQ